MYNEAHNLCQKIPTWTQQTQNPINHFVPTQEQAFKPREDVSKAIADNERMMRYTQLAGKDRTLMLAGTQALNKREMSPHSKLRQTRGIATTKRVADNYEVRNSLA